ncbi:polyketide cyclase [Subtercola sp. Z020]|uniref:nuclear transport factor 2 family protein n=1 Tax=Subtercola sp. Z020 TaxID=2080582 RepID=UPI000CE73B0C|nr:nuclear transport factor 2 family protein [Subtercola sp. Z020]PPF89592.1 polyketide cyclase [Subtercola sp. Z020]
MTGNREAFETFCDLFYSQKRVREAFDFLVSPDYIQHNPGLPDGPGPAIEGLTPKFDGSPDSRFDIQRTIVEGDLAMVHVRASGPGRPDTAVADLYRFEDGRIVEHWDVLQQVPEASVSRHPMF